MGDYVITLAQAYACGHLAGRPPDALPKNIPFTVGRYHASTGHRLPVFDCLFSLVLFPLPKLSVGASLFAI